MLQAKRRLAGIYRSCFRFEEFKGLSIARPSHEIWGLEVRNLSGAPFPFRRPTRYVRPRNFPRLGLFEKSRRELASRPLCWRPHASLRRRCGFNRDRGALRRNDIASELFSVQVLRGSQGAIHHAREGRRFSSVPFCCPGRIAPPIQRLHLPKRQFYFASGLYLCGQQKEKEHPSKKWYRHPYIAGSPPVQSHESVGFHPRRPRKPGDG